MNTLREWLRRDENVTSGRGWSVNLDLFRIFYLSFAVIPWAFGNLRWIDGVMSHLPASLWVPISFYRWIPIAIVSDAKLAHVVAIANLIFLFLGLVGCHTRLTLGCASVLSIYLFGLTENQGKIDHMHHLVWFLILFAAGPAGRFLSIDSLRRARKNTDPDLIEPGVDPYDALWTLRFVWVLLGILYLVPGLAKLDQAFVSGWATPVNLLNVFWRKWLELSLFISSALAPSVRLDLLPPWMLVLGGLSAIAFEIGFLFVVLFRKLRAPAGVAGVGFHVLNGLALQIWFTTLLPAYVALIDWHAFGRRLLQVEKRPTIILFDARCSFCSRALTVLKSLDLFDVLRPIRIDSASASRFSTISREAQQRDLHVIDGSKVYAGYEAYQQIARRLPLLWPACIAMCLPGISRIGDRVYRKIADSRHCSIKPPRNGLPMPQRPNRAVLFVGGALVACQFAIGFVMWADTELRADVDRMPAPIRRIALGIGKRMPVWPFTYYPTFASPTPSEQCIWQGSWVIAGRGIVIGPATWAHALQNSGAIWGIVQDPGRASRRRSLDLLDTLWKAESADVRSSATGALVNHVCYRLGPASQAPGRIENTQFLFSFPINEIAH